MDELTGRVALVTGGGGGIGRASALCLAGAGAHVVVSDIDQERGARTVEMIRGEGGTADFVRCDVSRADEVDALVRAAVEVSGALHCAVNAAGIEFEASPLHEASEQDFERIMDVNVRSVFLCMRSQIAVMLGQEGGGSIVNIASTNATKPQPGTPLYTTSKHAVLGMVRAAAVDYASKGIRVNAISPGAIDTPMLRGAIQRRGGDPAAFARVLSPMRRFGEADEVGRAALWLCSDASSFTTGANISVDGGLTAA